MIPPCHLYRVFDHSGSLLYVGISLSVLGRLSEHRNQPWFKDIAHVKVQIFPTRAAADDAETKAIKTERPIFNKAKTDKSLAERNEMGTKLRRNVLRFDCYGDDAALLREIACVRRLAAAFGEAVPDTFQRLYAGDISYTIPGCEGGGTYVSCKRACRDLSL